jgi:ankyrin repeat protein
MSNVWRVFNKTETIIGPESYINRVMQSQRWKSKLQDWKLTMLHVAIRDVKLLILQLLIELGADVDLQKEISKRAPLHTAAFREDKRFVQMLLENKADPSLIDRDGHNPLHQAILNGFEETATYLIEHGFDINAKTGTGMTPLMLACGFELTEGADSNMLMRLVKKLLAEGADVSLTDEEGQTALHCAVANCGFDTIEVLVAAGADVNAADSSGRSLIHYLAGGTRVGNCYDFRDIRTLREILEFLLIR